MELPREAPRKEHERVMDENGTTPGSSKVPHGHAGLPYKTVGAVLFGVVLVLLGAAFFLNSRLRPPTTIETAVAASAPRPLVITPTILPPAAAASSMVSAPTGLPSTSTPTISSTASATSSSSSPAASATVQLPPGVHIASSPLEQEIEAAYLHYWQVRSEALLNLDTSHLSEVMAGPELARDDKQIQDLKAQGKAVKVDIEHHIAFLHVSPDAAEIYDEYLNRSVYVDPTTKQAIPTNSPPLTAKVSYQMQKVNGTWKVIDGAQHT